MRKRGNGSCERLEDNGGNISEGLCSKEATFKDNLETVSECEEDVGLSMRRDLSKD